VATLVLRHPKQQKDQLISFVELEIKAYPDSSNPKILDNPEQYSEVVSTLSDACKRKLPAYMAPTHFLPISAMPLSVNNKVDNKKLKGLYHEASLELLQSISRSDEGEGSWSEAEQRIRNTLADMTGLEASVIERSSTVFGLGLDSVSVVGLARRLKRAGFVASSVSLIMQCKFFTHPRY
jgi:aryl carrier-like protein